MKSPVDRLWDSKPTIIARPPRRVRMMRLARRLRQAVDVAFCAAVVGVVLWGLVR